MAERLHRCLLLADFNTENLRSMLGNDTSLPAVEAQTTPFGQVGEPLIDEAHECWQAHPDSIFLWTQPHAVISGFARLLAGEEAEIKQMLLEVDGYSDQVCIAASRVSHVFVATWVLPPQRGPGMMDLTHEGCAAGVLLQMNTRLVQNLARERNVFVHDAQRWIGNVGKAAYSPHLWFMAKVPFANAVLKEAVADLKAALCGLAGKARKLVILDLDDTMWGGIIGDVGWEQIKLGGHDPIGEAFAEFQRALKALKNRGIVLGIVSKNEESVALAAIAEHPDMVLRKDDFAGWRINWNDKARNIAELCGELNLGLQSVVFIDDNPVERDRVRSTLPEVLVPDWPADRMLYCQALAQLRCFDMPAISGEDRARADMYTIERQRRDLQRSLGSLDDWLKSLDIRVSAELLSQANLSRAAQLFNKTNQMNLATRRLTDDQLWTWANSPGQTLWTLRVADRFGDSGLVGIVSLKERGTTGEIVDFILSCRVFGRGIEEAMLWIAVEHARSNGMTVLGAQHLPTAKNEPTLSFFKRSGLREEKPGHFSWNLDLEYPVPTLITLELINDSTTTA